MFSDGLYNVIYTKGMGERGCVDYSCACAEKIPYRGPEQIGYDGLLYPLSANFSES